MVTMTILTDSGAPATGQGAVRSFLVAVWLLAGVASAVAQHRWSWAGAAVAAFLLWRVWRGGRYSYGLLLGLSLIAAALAVAMLAAIALGAPGIVIPTLIAFILYAAAGGLLASPVVHGSVTLRRTSGASISQR
jgi:hypothetical protein